MERIKFAGQAAMVSMWAIFAVGCIVAPPPHEGYYDHEHHRYYEGGGWHDCGDHDDHCR